MTNLYYTDPLAAAYMAREFGVEFTHVIPDLGVMAFADKEKFEVSILGNRHAFTTYRDKAEVHPDSLHIFEPMEGDIATARYGRKINTGTFGLNGQLIYADGVLFNDEYEDMKIIQRNNKPFFMPEKEQA